MRKFITLIVAFSAVVLVGCTTLFTSTVALTQIEDSAMKEWASMSVKGLTSAQLDQQVMVAHEKYRQAALIAANALEQYKNGGDKARWLVAFEAVRASIGPIVDLITPLISPAKQATYKTQLAKATKL